MTTPKPKRDRLVAEERAQQEIWDFRRVRDPTKPKYMATFPYAYMNGRLHLGHALTISQVDFMCRYQELQGKHVLFPFAYHGTGMPIVACANRLKQELSSGNRTGPQATNLLKMGVQDQDLDKFQNPKYWLIHWPLIAKQDLHDFGACVDLSREFVTTDMNPHYDSFIKWQFAKLNQNHKLIFGKKPVVYSELDKQPCADHDRSVGEGIGIKEYSLVRFYSPVLDLDLLVATSRPDTMTAVTNLWVNPNMTYLVVDLSGKQTIISPWGYRNLKNQISEEMSIIREISGSDLVGIQVNYSKVILPVHSLDAVEPEKGTGIVASVPAHCLSDYKNYKKIGGDMNSLPIAITIPETTVPEIIKSELSKNIPADQISKKIFILEQEQGLINGEALSFALPKIKANFSKYYEPDGIVISRSGDRCIVALVEQWFINYGDPEWTARVNKHIDTMQTYDESVRESLRKTSEWISEWPCSRSYGLGTQLLDTPYIIDSLSDSTIYMAYYTVAHLITKIPTDLLCFEIWDFLFGDQTILSEKLIKYASVLQEAKDEFMYWYNGGVDLRVSAKDLLGNHLTMALYNHAEIWPISNYCPRAYKINGYLLLNGEKMSKSTGNFKTLREAIDEYGADATRFALAEAGAGLDDSNFTDKSADTAVLHLSNEKEWVREEIAWLATNPEPTHENFWDKVFMAEIDACIHKSKQHYENMNYRQVVVDGIYQMWNARNNYRIRYSSGLIPKNPIMIRRFLEVHLALIYPICPHYASDLMIAYYDKPIKIGYPTPTSDYEKIIWISDGINICVDAVRSKYTNIMKRYKKKGNSEPPDLELVVTSYPHYSKIELALIEQMKEMLISGKDWKEIINTILESSTDKKNIGRFTSFIKKKVEDYGYGWFDWIQRSEEFALVQEWLPKLVHDLNLKTINVQEGEPKIFINAPWFPDVQIHVLGGTNSSNC